MRLVTALLVLALAVAACGSAEDEPAAADPDQPVEAPARHDTVATPADPAACKRLSRHLAGRSLEAARSQAAEAKCALRVVSLDGEDLAVTDDFSRSRINVRVESGRVAAVTGLF
jgi:hypothetical protein